MTEPCARVLLYSLDGHGTQDFPPQSSRCWDYRCVPLVQVTIFENPFGVGVEAREVAQGLRGLAAFAEAHSLIPSIHVR